MSYRCISAFEFANRIYSGGAQVSDDDPILKTHGVYFAQVTETPVVATEIATAGPGEKRDVPHKVPAKKAPGRPPAYKPEPESDKPEGEN